MDIQKTIETLSEASTDLSWDEMASLNRYIIEESGLDKLYDKVDLYEVYTYGLFDSRYNLSEEMMEKMVFCWSERLEDHGIQVDY